MKVLFAFARGLELAPESDAPLPKDLVWMPVGEHDICAGTSCGTGFQGRVVVDAEAADSVIASFDRVSAEGRRAWIDYNHADADAAAWISAFSWDPSRGIVASVEWTADGARALREKRFYSFSPAFTIDPTSGRVSGLYEGHAAGGLVNAPAFGNAMPTLIAAKLNGDEIAALKAEIEKLKAELAEAKEAAAAAQLEGELKGVDDVPDEVRAALSRAFLDDPAGARAVVAQLKRAHRHATVIVASDAAQRANMEAGQAVTLDPYDRHLERIKLLRTSHP